MTQLPPDLPPAWKPPHTPGQHPEQPGHDRRGVAATGFLAGILACLTCRCGEPHGSSSHDRSRKRDCVPDCCPDCGCGDGCDCCSCDCSC